MLLNGGPGTGKTTVLTELVFALVHGLGKKVLLCSGNPTTSDYHATHLYELRGEIKDNGKIVCLLNANLLIGNIFIHSSCVNVHTVMRKKINICRYGNPQHPNSPVSITKPMSKGDERKYAEFYKEMIVTSNVVCTTLDACGIVRLHK